MRTQHQSKRELDKIDRNILRILQEEGRIPSPSWANASASRPHPAPNACAAWSAKA